MASSFLSDFSKFEDTIELSNYLQAFIFPAPKGHVDCWIKKQHKFPFEKKTANQSSNPQNYPPKVKGRNK